MPLYSYQCPDCEEVIDEHRSVAERNNTPLCKLCRTKTRKIISAYHVYGDIDPYYDDNLQVAVRSKQHRRDIMKEQGVSERFGENWHTAKSSKQKRGHGKFN